MRALILVAALGLIAACHDDDAPIYPQADNTVDMNATAYTYRDCPDGSTVRSTEPCPKEHEPTKEP